jgi:hypothetical protein
MPARSGIAVLRIGLLPGNKIEGASQFADARELCFAGKLRIQEIYFGKGVQEPNQLMAGVVQVFQGARAVEMEIQGAGILIDRSDDLLGDPLPKIRRYGPKEKAVAVDRIEIYSLGKGAVEDPAAPDSRPALGPQNAFHGLRGMGNFLSEMIVNPPKMGCPSQIDGGGEGQDAIPAGIFPETGATVHTVGEGGEYHVSPVLRQADSLRSIDNRRRRPGVMRT